MSEEIKKLFFRSAIVELLSGIAKALEFAPHLPPKESCERYGKIQELKEEILETLGYN